MTDKPVSVVLVHGGFVDGSGWQGVHDILAKDGYEVIVVQNPTISLADDVAVTRRAIAAANIRSSSSATPTAVWSLPKPETIPRSNLAYIAAFAPDAAKSSRR